MELIPLSIVSSQTVVYVNATTAVETVLVWVAAHGADGAVAVARPKDTPTTTFTIVDGAPAVTIKCAVPPNEAVLLLPGSAGTLAVRVTDSK
ncbi:MAG: hypothetical protein R3E10_06810 [Gemmatimonadota bacterium]